MRRPVPAAAWYLAVRVMIARLAVLAVVAQLPVLRRHLAVQRQAPAPPMRLRQAIRPRPARTLQAVCSTVLIPATSVSITATASNIVSGSLAGTAPAPGPNQPGKVGPDDTHFVSAALHTAPMWGPMVVSTLFLWMWVM